MFRSRFTARVLVVSLVASLVVGVSWAPAEAAAAGSSASSDKSVPVRPGVGRAGQRSQTDGPGVIGAAGAVLPSAASAVVATTVATSDAVTSVGGLPVGVSVVLGAEDDFLSDARMRAGARGWGPSTVRVDTAGPQAAQSLGVRGVVLSV